MTIKNGYATRKREWILKFLADNPDREVGVNEINEFLTDNSIEVNLTTIYRYLDRLVEQGIVLKTAHGKKEQATYQYINGKAECGHHLHMKCTGCGKVMHLDCGFMEEIAAHVRLEHGFTIDCKNSYLMGLCRNCSNNAFNHIVEECNCNEKE